jgi:hypothetical protein
MKELKSAELLYNNNNNNKYLQILTSLEDNFDPGSCAGYLAVWCTYNSLQLFIY